MVRTTLAAVATASPAPFLSLVGVEESDTGKEMIRERSNPKPLHNFTLPRLGWGSQIQMRCVKVTDRSVPYSESSSSLSVARPGFGPKEDEDCDGIEAVGKEFMLDLRTKRDMVEKELWKKGEEDEMVVAGKLDGQREAEEELVTETRPWNLRTRRAACKAPVGRNGSPVRKACLVAEEAKVSAEKFKEREKFSVALKRKEIEDDFWKLTGHRPPRRPKKRLRAVQKQLDMLFPGLWLTEITADAYKVMEVPDNGKR